MLFCRDSTRTAQHDILYEHLLVDCRISPDQRSSKKDQNGQQTFKFPAITVKGVTQVAILLLNRQIHDECCKYAPPRFELSIHFGLAPTSEPAASFTLIHDLPDGLLKSTKNVKIDFGWPQLLMAPNNSYESRWLSEHSIEELRAQDQMPWTPSKGFCTTLKEILLEMQTLISVNAIVTVSVALDCLPDPNDQLSIGLDRAGASLCSHLSGERISHIVHIPTISGMERDKTLQWPTFGDLSIEYTMETPLFCTQDDMEAVRLQSTVDARSAQAALQ